MPRDFEILPAERKAQFLFIGLVSPSGAGKSFSALELAVGMQSVFGGEIVGIDTETNRMLAYADMFKKSDGSPGFLHINFEPPHGSLDYADVIQFAATKGKTIIVDGGSNEHDSMLEFHDAEVHRLAGDDWAKQERVKMLAWAKPKGNRRKLIKTITSLNANVIMCFRARETSKPAKDDRGKNVVIPMGFVPNAAPELVFEMALSALLLPGARGVPTWDPEHPGERIAVKLPAQFEWLRDHGGPLNREVGRRLAEWAVGNGHRHGVDQTKKPDTTEPTAQSIDLPALQSAGEFAAKRGGDVLKEWWGTLSNDQKSALKPFMPDIKAKTQAVDDARVGEPV